MAAARMLPTGAAPVVREVLHGCFTCAAHRHVPVSAGRPWAVAASTSGDTWRHARIEVELHALFPVAEVAPLPASAAGDR